jgi:hypothetical protein
MFFGNLMLRVGQRTGAGASPIDLTGLLHYWRMDDATGTTHVNRVAGGPSLVSISSANRVAGKIGNAMEATNANHPGLTSAVQPAPIVTNGYTWAAWAYAPSGTTTHVPIDQTVGWATNGFSMFWSSTAPDARCVVYRSSVASSCTRAGNIPFDQWNFWVATYRAADQKMRFYFNSEPVIVASTGVAMYTGSQKIAVSTIQTLQNGTGLYDEVMIFQREWSAADVVAMYNGGAGVNLGNFL